MEQARLEELLTIEEDYKRLKALLDHAASGGSLEKYTGEMLLYVEPATGQILDASSSAIEFLGYSLSELQKLKIDMLEKKTKETISLFENNQPFELYEANYRHKDNYQLRVNVRSRQIIPVDKKILRYSLEDKSLYRKLWNELSRREDSDFQFREKLKILNEINLELGRVDSFDELCRRSVELGRERLGLDRLSIWFIDRNQRRMLGSFGVDEAGNLRDERGLNWRYGGGDVEEFLAGRREPIIVNDAPLYNDLSEYIGYGWHVSVPLLDGSEFIGFMGVDNFINKQALKSYQPDLLRLFGATIGHLAARQRDITALKESKERELELRLEQERLRLLGNFVSDIGHEFKTPLTVIKSSAYFLSKSTDESKRQSQIPKIEESVAYLNQLLNMMLEMVSLDSQQQLNSSNFALDRLISELLQTLRPSIDAKELRVEFESKTMPINADGLLLRRAFEEILKNAIEYTPPQGQIRLNLRESTNHYHIIVEDTGIGIPADEFEKIFQRFYRLDKARSTRNGGLGLAIAKRVIDLHHGEIFVQSVLGEGSHFEIRLPKSLP